MCLKLHLLTPLANDTLLAAGVTLDKLRHTVAWPYLASVVQ